MEAAKTYLESYKKPFFTFLSIFIFGVLIGYFLANPKANTEATETKPIRLQEGYTFINPLLECDSRISDTKPVRDIKAKVEAHINTKLASQEISHASVYYRDMNNGPWFGIGEKTLFSPASLVKVPMMMAYFKLAEENTEILDQKLKTPSDIETYYELMLIKPKAKLQPETEYSVIQLIEHMIVSSDNVAFEMLKNNILEEQYVEIYRDMGVDLSHLNDNTNTGNILTIKDYASFFRILYNSSYLTRKFSEQALEILSRIEFDRGIRAGVPNHILVSHKFGERSYEFSPEKQLHDCGIVYHSKRPYLICIMTRGDDTYKLAQTIKEISDLVFNELL